MSVVAANTHLIKPMATTTNSCLLISSLPSLKTISFKPTSTKIQQLSCTFSQKKTLKLSVARATTDFNWGSDSVVEEETGEFNGTSEEPPEEAKIYVGNLSYDVDSETLAGVFQEAGVVETAEVIYDRDTGRSRGFAFVTMSTVEEAEKAVEMFSGSELSGRQLTINKAAPKGARPERTERAPRGAFDGSSRIYVGNLPWSADDESLEQAFSEYGKVVSARVVSDRETGRSRGFGFVVMSSESETKDAIANLDGQDMDGRSIRVNVAEDKPRQQRRF